MTVAENSLGAIKVKTRSSASQLFRMPVNPVKGVVLNPPAKKNNIIQKRQRQIRNPRKNFTQISELKRLTKEILIYDEQFIRKQ